MKSFLSDSGVVFPKDANLEISHHYGIDSFYEVGLTMITVVNREYCKKLLITLPGQTFVVLHGNVILYLDDAVSFLCKGDVVTIEPGVRHKFESTDGCVIEEVSSTHYQDDSYYTDLVISQNQNRKTFIPYWMA